MMCHPKESRRINLWRAKMDYLFLCYVWIHILACRRLQESSQSFPQPPEKLSDISHNSPRA
jgi:hypothetical protein